MCGNKRRKKRNERMKEEARGREDESQCQGDKEWPGTRAGAT